MRTIQVSAGLKRWMQAVAAVALVSAIAACGGGGGDNNSNSSSNSQSGLNGGTLPASPTQQPIAANAANTVAVTVGSGLQGVINIPTVSVTVCAPGSTSNCQTIDNIQVDTGSYGLRIVNTALGSVASSLPVSTPSAGVTLAECATFADGYTWGTVRTANVQIGGETAASIPIQVIGDMSAASVPTRGCGSGSAENTAADLGANGILGIGVAPQDCGATCANAATAANFSNYFSCPGGTSCTRATVALANQVANPVAHFPVDNNGLILQMPPVSSTGSASAVGTLVFGINTQTNNALGTAQTLTTDAFGDLNSSTFNGSAVSAFLDSGSNGYFFADNSLTLCNSTYAGFYCPSSAQTRTVNLVGVNGTTATASLGILSAATLFANTNNYAFNDLAGQIGVNSSFDVGLPFFYGRHIYYGLDQTASGGQSPFIGY